MIDQKSCVIVVNSRDDVKLAADVWNATAVPTVLLLTAGAEVRTVWQPVVAQLSAKITEHWRIVAADHRGHGDSGRSDIYRFSQFFDDLHCWTNELRAVPLIVVGGSIGGALGMVAAGEGSNIDGLVLLDVPTVPAFTKVLDERARITRAHDTAHPAMSHVDPRFIAAGFIEDIVTDIDRWRRAACQLKIPTLLVTAGRGVMGPEQHRQFHEHVPHGEIATLDTTHLVARDDPDGVAKLIEAFLLRHFSEIAS